MSEQQSPVLASVRNRVGHLTLNRPSALNTLNLLMVGQLFRHLWVWEKDPEIVAVTIRGAGEKAFCAGGDIRMLYDSHIEAIATRYSRRKARRCWWKRDPL